MRIFVISYDLRSPGRNYDSLYRSLKSVPYAHILESVWLVEFDGGAELLKDTLKSNMDANDGLMVLEVTKDADWAVSGVTKPVVEWLQAKRP